MQKKEIVGINMHKFIEGERNSIYMYMDVS